jgi:hypothetical protein
MICTVLRLGCNSASQKSTNCAIIETESANNWQRTAPWAQTLNAFGTTLVRNPHEVNLFFKHVDQKLGEQTANTGTRRSLRAFSSCSEAMMGDNSTAAIAVLVRQNTLPKNPDKVARDLRTTK